jgi:RimJ/RimL family protein N-acetyltransferase
MSETGSTTESPLDRVAWPVRTERLTLRAGTPEDADRTFAYRQLESVSEWISTHSTDPDDYREKFLDPGRLASTVIAERDGDLIGDFMVRVEDVWAQTEVADRAKGRQVELGWVLDPAYTGQGYATEAVRALLGVCFEQLGMHRVVALCFAGNEASWRLMERVGMRREGHMLRDSLHRSGAWMDGLTYAMLADEWNSR